MAKKSLKSRRKALQRKRAKRTQKRTEARSRASRRLSKQTDPRQVGEWPLHEYLLTERWQDPGELVQILVSRRGSQGQVATAAFLVDLGCLGVKNAHSAVTESDRAHRQIREDMERHQKMSPASLNLVAKIIREGIAYADQLGFRPHRDYDLAKWVLGDADPDACEDPIPLGRDGKPFFVAGPFDDVPKIMARLERAVGSDGFDYLVHLEPPPNVLE